MKLDVWMKRNEPRWSIHAYAKYLGIADLTLKHIISKKKDITLKMAMQIVEDSDGKVTLNDLV